MNEMLVAGLADTREILEKIRGMCGGLEPETGAQIAQIAQIAQLAADGLDCLEFAESALDGG